MTLDPAHLLGVVRPEFGDWVDPLVLLVVLGLPVFLAGLLGRRLMERRIRRRLAAGRTVLAVRVLHGARGGLPTRWRLFLATPSFGVLRLRTWLPRGRPETELRVVTVDRTPRRLGLRDAVWVNGTYLAVTARTREGAVELAVRPDHVDWLVRELTTWTNGPA